jgi:hypothetical protein
VKWADHETCFLIHLVANLAVAAQGLGLPERGLYVGDTDVEAYSSIRGRTRPLHPKLSAARFGPSGAAVR